MRFLITAGPTREAIDPVRYLSNRSSGKMGYAVAEAAVKQGHDVTLISGPVHLNPPEGCEVVSVTTAEEMFHAVMAHINFVDVAILVAAVADFRPAEYASEKIKKDSGPPVIHLVPTKDILAELGRVEDRKFLLIGFAAETQDVENNAIQKLERKRCDLIVGNDVSLADKGFESDRNAVIYVAPHGIIGKSGERTKHEIAQQLVEKSEELYTKKFSK